MSQYAIYSVCHQHMIFLLLSLNIVIETLATCGHSPRTTKLSSSNKNYSCEKYLWAIASGKEYHPSPKLSQRYQCCGSVGLRMIYLQMTASVKQQWLPWILPKINIKPTIKESADAPDGLYRAVMKNSPRWNEQSAMTYIVHCIANWRISSGHPPIKSWESSPRRIINNCIHSTTCRPNKNARVHASRAIRPNPVSFSNWG